MTGSEFATYVRKKTRTDSSTFPDAELIALANPIKDDLAGDVEAINEDYFGSVETTDLLVTSTTREYPLPEDILNRITYLEIQFDGTNWVKVESLDLSKYKRTNDESTIQQYFSNEEGYAFFDIFRGSLWLYCGAVETQVDAGIKLRLFTYPAPLSADGSGTGDDATLDLSGSTQLSEAPSTTTHGFPRPLHRIWADSIIVEYKGSREKPIPLTESERNLEYRKAKVLERMKGLDMKFAFTADVPEDPDSDNGFNY